MVKRGVTILCGIIENLKLVATRLQYKFVGGQYISYKLQCFKIIDSAIPMYKRREWMKNKQSRLQQKPL